jgi:hypothetical protein
VSLFLEKFIRGQREPINGEPILRKTYKRLKELVKGCSL